MRFVIATFEHETNTFSPLPTELGRFEAWGLHTGADAQRAHGPARVPMATFMVLARAAGAEFETPIAASVQRRPWRHRGYSRRRLRRHRGGAAARRLPRHQARGPRDEAATAWRDRLQC